MRALTLTQPWAGLVASGIKRIENRPRRMINSGAIGTQFAIHASRQIDESVYERIAEIAPDILTFERRGEASFSTGELLGPEQVRWFFGPVGYALRDIIALDVPIPCKGKLGFWTLPDDVERQVREQLGERAE